MPFKNWFSNGEATREALSRESEIPTIADALERKRLRDEYERPDYDIEKDLEGSDSTPRPDLKLYTTSTVAEDGFAPTVFDRMLDAKPETVKKVLAIGGGAVASMVIIPQIIDKVF